MATPSPSCRGGTIAPDRARDYHTSAMCGRYTLSADLKKVAAGDLGLPISDFGLRGQRREVRRADVEGTHRRGKAEGRGEDLTLEICFAGLADSASDLRVRVPTPLSPPRRGIDLWRPRYDIASMQARKHLNAHVQGKSSPRLASAATERVLDAESGIDISSGLYIRIPI